MRKSWGWTTRGGAIGPDIAGFAGADLTTTGGGAFLTTTGGGAVLFSFEAAGCPAMDMAINKKTADIRTSPGAKG
jgi:hypothetical protein